MTQEFRSYRDESRKKYGRMAVEDEGFGLDQLTLGCLMRIADAAEVVSGNYKNLLDDRAYYESRFRDELARHKQTIRKLRAAKGRITKLKNTRVKLANMRSD